MLAITKPFEKPKGTQVKALTLTKDALDQGIKPGERVVSEEAAPTTALPQRSDKPGRLPRPGQAEHGKH